MKSIYRKLILEQAGVSSKKNHFYDLEPLDKLKIITHASTLAREVATSEEDICKLRRNAGAMNAIAARVDNGEITEDQGIAEYKNLMDPIKNEHEPLASINLHSSNHKQNVEIGQATVKAIDQNIRQQNEFVARVADAKLALELAVNSFRKDSLTFLDEMGTYLVNVRQTRMALDQETRHLLTAAGDVRKFFLSEDHPRELERLKEFVAIMERLQALKNSGFLDAVTDTILKLAPPV